MYTYICRGDREIIIGKILEKVNADLGLEKRGQNMRKNIVGRKELNKKH